MLLILFAIHLLGIIEKRSAEKKKLELVKAAQCSAQM